MSKRVGAGNYSQSTLSASHQDYAGYDTNYIGSSSPSSKGGYTDPLPEIYNGDPDAITVHRRKMMRRAANRRSAQLSRARKKVSSNS